MSVSYDFSGQTAIVTGGARGIGRAVATQFVRSGAYVWIWDVDPIELDGAQSLKVDVTNSDQIAKAVSHVLGQSQRIDILVNDAGYQRDRIPNRACRLRYMPQFRPAR